MSDPHSRATIRATAIEYAKAGIRRRYATGEFRVPCPCGLTLHNLAARAVTPALLALARINLRRAAERSASADLQRGMAELLREAAQ